MATRDGVKTGGREKGVKNKRTFDAQALAERLGVDPLEILLHAASNNFKALGYDSAIRIKAVGEGVIEEDTIPISIRIQAAKEAVKHLYPTLKAVEHTGKDGEKLFTIEDFINGAKNGKKD